MHDFAGVRGVQVYATDGSAPPPQTFVVFQNGTRLFKVVTRVEARAGNGLRAQRWERR